ncbi:MAG TPA: transporter substrate-binding domain-containing protein [Ramlibacter sp.]|jgi:polar amino acid transport system substrate-binding protein
MDTGTHDRAAALRLLAPQGRLRAAINYGNLALARRAADGSEPGGIAVDLARALAAALGVPCDLVGFDAAGKVTDGMDGWDVAFLAVDPARAERLAFTPAYVQIAACYMVHADSPLRTPADVDAPGRRVAVGRGAAYDLHLSRALQHARLERCATAPEAFALFESQPLDAAAGVRRVVQQYAGSRPHLRVMDEDFLAIDQALCVPRDRLAGQERGLDWLAAWVESAKRDALVAQAVQRSGETGIRVAPPA